MNEQQSAEPVEDTAVEQPDQPGPEGGEQSPSREAAKWRRQLRDTEAERDALRDRVLEFERAEVERFAAEHLADPADLWRDVELDGLRGKDGRVDAGKVDAAVKGVLEAHPHWQRSVKQRPPARGLRSGATGSDERGSVSWADAFRR
ncbi:hypothetical protein IU487_22680 [Nocardia puris]|uniref:hypothetical protein n=1 Tax=Nocardia puris TaxID=208602 RepID=UPI00189550DB|nr:hypothetical protein [Nocardia puris]MBF6213826.1 hypothetical protein [Nocardia puris]